MSFDQDRQVVTLTRRSCRLTGAAAFTGLGLYAMNQGRLQGALRKVRPPGAPVMSGQISMLIGVGKSGMLDG